jgi:hypothetical protein
MPQYSLLSGSRDAWVSQTERKGSWLIVGWEWPPAADQVVQEHLFSLSARNLLLSQ